jgi:hypothetical protein
LSAWNFIPAFCALSISCAERQSEQTGAFFSPPWPFLKWMLRSNVLSTPMWHLPHVVGMFSWLTGERGSFAS